MLVHELEDYVPHTDRNIIYSVHYYEPSQFSHQGAVWMKSWYHALRRVPWPLTKDNLEQAIANVAKTGSNKGKAPHSAKALRDCVKQGLGTRERVDTNFSKIAAWATKHNRRMYIGEFGVMLKYAPSADRCRATG